MQGTRLQTQNLRYGVSTGLWTQRL